MPKWIWGAAILAIAGAAYWAGQRSTACADGEARDAAGKCVATWYKDSPVVDPDNPAKYYQQAPIQAQVQYAQPQATQTDVSAQLREIREAQRQAQSDAQEAAYQAQRQASELRNAQQAQALLNAERP